MAGQSQQVVKHAGNLTKEYADVLGPKRDRTLEELLHRQGVPVFLGHHGHVVQAVKVRQGLHVVLILNQLLGAPVEQANVWVRTFYYLTVHLQHQP
eukprot:29642-Pelagococcus_subviridis.AAC.19